MTETAFAVVIVLLPAVVVAWQGSRLRRQLESPTLAEQWWSLRMRVGQLVAVAVVLLALVLSWHAVWLLPLVAVLALAAGFPTRRAVLGETWGFAAYLLWLCRLFMVFAGIWAALMLTPLIVATFGPQNPWVIGAWGLVLAIWLSLRKGWMVKVLGAVPLTPDEQPQLQSFAAEVAAGSAIPRPRLLKLELAGGRWPNAVALVDVRSPAVVFSNQLFELLSPAELRAIYAHELAHVEHFTPRRLRKLAVGMWCLAVLGLATTPVSVALSGAPGLGILGFVCLLFVVTIARSTAHQKNEGASDLRALELCGDADAVISALRAVHLAGRVPRRLASEQERRMTHPSLARRIQAIRAAAGIREEPTTPAIESSRQPGPENPPVRSEPATIAAVAGGAGRYLLFDEDRLSWLDGVPSGVVGDPAAMRASARSTQSVAYGELAELRLARKATGALQLVVGDRRLRRRTTILNEADAAAVQKALDRADSLLGAAQQPSFAARLGSTTLPARVAAGTLVLSALVVPAGMAVAGLALVTLILPRSPWLMATATSCLGGLMVAWLEPTSHSFLFQGSLRSLHGLILGAALILLAYGIARSFSAPEDRGRWAWLPPALMAGSVAAFWVVLLAGAGLVGDGGLDLYRLHCWVSGSAILVALPPAAAVTWLAVARRRQWWLAGVLGLVLLPALWVRSESFRNAHVHDFFIATAAPTEPGRPLLPGLVWRAELPASSSAFRLSPDGRKLARSSGRHAAGTGPVRWQLLDESGDTDSVAAVDLAFAADGSVLAIVSDGGNWFLRRALVDDSWVVALPPLDSATLELDPSSDAWAVMGHREADLGYQITRLVGPIGGGVEHTTTIPIDDEYFWPGSVSWLGSEGVIRQSYGALDDLEEGAPWSYWLEAGRSSLSFLSPTEERRLPRSAVAAVECRASSFAEPSVLCLANDVDRLHLWRVDAGHPDEPVHLLTIRGRYAAMNAVSERWVALGTLGQSLLVDRRSGAVVPLELPTEPAPGAVVALSDAAIAVSFRSFAGHEVAVYRLAE